jgi:VanZ family protein
MATAQWTTLNIQTHRPATSRWPNLLQTWLPVLLFAGVFAIESTPTFGANHTSAPLHAVLHALFGSAIDPRWSGIHHMIRKIGHFSGYGIFSLIAFRGISRSLHQRKKFSLSSGAQTWVSHGMAIAAAFAVANADEIHQTFLANRTGCFADVVIDTTGAIVLQAGLFLVLRLAANRRIDPVNQAQTQMELPLAA